jgi:prevent-host-death family protein
MDRSVSTVGSRELKTRLGSYLKRVRRGQAFIVTDRREPVAELRPPSTSSPIEARLAAMAALGGLTMPSAKRVSPFAPLDVAGSPGSRAIRDDRDEGL